MTVKHQLKKLTLFLTKRCNMRCPTCLWLLQDEDFFKNQDLSLDKAIEVIDYYYNEGIKKISIQAEGEILLYPNYINILKYSIEKGFHKTSIVTNGILLNSYKEALAKYTNNILISLDGYNESTYSYRRAGTKKMFQKVLSGIKDTVKFRNSMQINQKISISSVIGSFNMHYMSKMIQFAESLKVDQVTLRGFHSYGTKNQNLNSRNQHLVKYLSKIVSKNNYTVDIILPSIAQPTNSFSCSMLFDTVTIASDLTSSPCCHIPAGIEYGKFSMKKDVYKGKELQKFREVFLNAKSLSELPKDCKSCPRLNQQTPSFCAKTQTWNGLSAYASFI